MHDRDLDPHLSDRAPKKRRISKASPAMEIHLTPIESALRDLLLDVTQYIREQEIAKGGSNVKNHPETVLRFTGGWVRDKLLGIESHDIDVGISSMTGYQFGMALKKYTDISGNMDKYRKGLPIAVTQKLVNLHKIEANPEKSKHLETVATKIFGLEIDLVNLRKETYSEESRNPQMEFGTAVEDALRRDATINALFYNLNESRLEDPTGRGLEDIQKKIIRTPLEPYQTFKDDPLRVLRLIRFASRLGYQIDPETRKAMQNEDIRAALKLKISKERVWVELEKMLRGQCTFVPCLNSWSLTGDAVGPDPRRALEFIDQLGLYSTIFVNHQDEVTADTSAWHLAYNALPRVFHPEPGDTQTLRAAADCVRKTLVRDKQSSYYAWVITAFAPWCVIPNRATTDPKGKPLPPRVVEVGRESFRCDNKTLNILKDAVSHYQQIIGSKSALLNDEMSGTPAEIRRQVGLEMRKWGPNWKAGVVLALLHEVMNGRDFSEGESALDDSICDGPRD